MIIRAQIPILSKYFNDKRYFIWSTSITDLFANYKRVGLCPTGNKDKREN